MSHIGYWDEGSGIPVVFLHGFCESKAIWRTYMDQLKNSFRVIAIDLPGFGESTLLPTTKMETLADAVAEVVDQLGCRKYVVVGHSLGGYVALAMAERYADRLLGLGMFHSTAFADGEEKKQNRNKTIEFLKTNGVPAFIEPFVPGLFYPQHRKKHQAAIEELITIGLNTSQQAIIATTEAMRDRPDRSHLVEELDIPVMYIVGKNDNAVPMEMSMAQIHLPKKSYVLLLSETAHMGMFEQTKETLDFVRMFVEVC